MKTLCELARIFKDRGHEREAQEMEQWAFEHWALWESQERDDQTFFEDLGLTSTESGVEIVKPSEQPKSVRLTTAAVDIVMRLKQAGFSQFESKDILSICQVLAPNEISYASALSITDAMLEGLTSVDSQGVKQ